MNDNMPYRKWVGVVLGILLNGSAHFLSGSRAAGLKWYFAISVCGILCVALIATPGTFPYMLGVVFGLSSVALWFVMLKQSYRPVRRIGFLGWLAVIALAAVLGNSQRILVRQFFCPFKVPTGAMQPTVLGIHGDDTPLHASDKPGILQRLYSGRSLCHIKATIDGTLSAPLPSNGDPSSAMYMVGSRLHQLPRYGQLLKQPGERVSTGEALWSGIMTAGDHVFVERLCYRFGKPKRGDIVVFRTDGIDTLPPDTFFIFRAVGLPGERIRIEPPFLVVNDQKVTEPEMFNRISSRLDGYAGFQLAAHATASGGYLAQPADEVTLGPDQYFVLGDNAGNSRDSRYWGPVPEKNIIGKVTRIYWPFTRINALEKK